MFNIESNSWETKSSYPYCSYMLADYSTISMSDFVLVIGGNCQQTEDIDSITHAIIAKFRNNKWTQAGNLMVPRRYHRSIVMNELVYVIGGRGTQ